MQPEKIHYKKSRIKQISFFIAFLAGVAIFGFMLIPLNRPDANVAFFVASTVLGLFTFWIVRKTATEARCPHCEVNLYITIENARSTGVNFNFCPSCGKSVKI